MERVMHTNEHVFLQSNGTVMDFLIDELLGAGGSCVAYNVTYFENGDIPHRGVLKEYCPAFLEEVGFSRNGTEIKVPDSVKEVFNAGLSDFKNNYKYINEYLSENALASNFHPVQIGLYEGNNTAYTLTSRDYGETYDKIDNENLLSIFRTALSVTKAVELYHNAEFLHLDIKPKNILMLNDVTELVKLFDYDSLTSIEKLKTGDVYGIPAPEDYYVPELESYRLDEIDIQTDIFEIGAMMFLKIFKRTPETYDMSYDSKYEVDTNELFTGISPQAKSEIIDLFKSTVQISKRLRFKTTKELKDKLEKIISLISEEKSYLLNLPKWQPSKYCVGRKTELKEIKRRLDCDGYVFVKGIGGLGKSEIAKMFTEQYKEEYHTVQFCRYTDSLKTLVATMPVNGVDDKDYKNADELYKEKNKILHSSDSKTLIIVDNFNVTFDEFLRDFLPNDSDSFKVIFTTRCAMAAEYYEGKTYNLPKLSLNDCKQLFLAHSKQIETDDAVIESIIEYVDYNTLIIVLMTNAMRRSGISAMEMLKRLEEQEIDSVEDKVFHEYDFSSEEVEVYNKINAHLMTIFSVYSLDVTQKEILKNATLISPNGISLDDFIHNCDSDNVSEQSVENIISLGWIDKNNENIITMHPIVSDLLAVNNELQRMDSYNKFVDYLEAFCNPEYCHFSIVLNKLACAKHLERRYKFESDFKQSEISAKLGRMYADVYQPIDAKKYLKKALKLAISADPETEIVDNGETVKIKNGYQNALITYLYYFLGEVEQDFGTKEKAIEYYNCAIKEGTKSENEFNWIVAESMTQIGKCYRDNHNNVEAYNEYSKALDYSRQYELNEYVVNAAKILLEICEALGWEDKLPIYQKIYNEYKEFEREIEELPGISELSEKIKNNDFKGALTAAEYILSIQREELGEDSPAYKDLSKNMWAYYALNGQKTEAERLIGEAIVFVEQTSGKDSVEMVELLIAASNSMRLSNDFEEAEKFEKEAIDICEKNGFVNEYAYVEAVFGLVSLYLMQNRNYEAKDLLDKIDASKYSGSEFLSDFVSTAGMVLCQLSEYDAIEPLCLELLERKNVDFFGTFNANIILAMINEQRGDLNTAFNYADAIKIDEKNFGSIKNEWLSAYYRTVARLYFRIGEYEKAVAEITQYIDTVDKQAYISYLLAILYSDRGLYYHFLGDKENSSKDFEKCKEILNDSNAPKELFVFVLNNNALLYEKFGEYEKAKELYEEIVYVYPQVLTPRTYFEAVVCNNIGWIEYNLENFDDATLFLQRAIKAFELLDACKTKDYFGAKNNLGLFCLKQEKHKKAIEQFYDMRKTYNPKYDETGEVAVKSNYGIIVSLFRMERAKEACEFACKDLELFEKWFGKLSPIRVELILQMGGLFREAGYSDCYEFFFMADELIEESEDYKSLNYAKLLNYLGCYYTDEKQQHGQAKSMFEESKELFEELNVTDDPMYQTVLNNIESVRDLLMDELIKRMAETMKNETQED